MRAPRFVVFPSLGVVPAFAHDGEDLPPLHDDDRRRRVLRLQGLLRDPQGEARGSPPPRRSSRGQRPVDVVARRARWISSR